MERFEMELRFAFPGGKIKTLTFSYDDGVVHDKRLIEIFNKHGIKGTFHLNSACTGTNKIPHSEYGTVYAGHEISCHGKEHPLLEQIPQMSLVEDMLEDRRNLESIAGYPVYGMSYPFGTYDSNVIRTLRSLGIVYARTTKSTGRFLLPDDFLEWHPTCHHKDNIEELGKRFLNWNWGLGLMYVWGHSYEFDNDSNWHIIENFCAQMAGNDMIWYATNIEIYEYIMAMRRLIVSADGSIVRNPSAVSVWVSAAGKVTEIPSGATVRLSCSPAFALVT